MIPFSLASRWSLLSMRASFSDLALRRVAWCYDGCCCSQWQLLLTVVVAARSGWSLAGSHFRSGGGGRRECCPTFLEQVDGPTRQVWPILPSLVVPLQSVQGGPSAAPSPTTNALTGASGVVTRPRFVIIPPVTTVSAAAADKGKKTKKDDSPAGPSSKRSKKAEAFGSLATAFLGSEVWLDEEVSFHLGPRVKDMLKDVSEEEALRTAGELSLRLSAICTKFPRADRSRIDCLEKELAAAKVELQEVKDFASDLKTQFDRLNVMKAEHAKCVGLLKAADDRAKEEQLKAKEATDELRKLQRRFDDLSLEHLAVVGSAADWQKNAKEYLCSI
ncbi:hypothetical protein DEO72_LG4g59 [Vigna unguiculata]|uniref:Uncharacterized protein n=1 Tax=Vigna unguiculata TaxID=3917 RepID=A0A4D6LKN0_VIGUN|nr:hypothetical protein DEO72_LG4g59 [Vigna unguiculata]